MDERSKLRADFEQLQREYKNMEVARKSYAEESLVVIRKQREMVEKLQQDNEALKAEIELESRYAQRRSVPDDVMSAITDEIEQYTAKVDVERRNSEQLTKQIDVMKAKILDQRKDMGGVNAAKENQAMINKQIRILENRLDKALVKYNESLSANKELQKAIEGLRQERETFDGIYRKMERALGDRKKAMSAIIEASNKAYEDRDNAQSEIARIQQSMSREKQEFEEAVVALNRQIDSTLVPSGEDESAAKSGLLSSEEEVRLRAALAKASAALARDKATVQANKDRVAAYEDGFSKIRAATGIKSIEELVETFTKNEDLNFSLFNFVAEQSNDIDRLEEQLAALKAEEKRLTLESGDDANQNKHLAKELEAKMQAAEAAAAKYEGRFAEASKTIDALKGGIQSLFTRIGCSERAISELLSDASVSEHSMMAFLGVIEQRANEVMQALASLTPPPMSLARRGSPESPSLGATLASLLGHGPPTQHGAESMATVVPPRVEECASDDNDSGDDGLIRPLTVEELKARTVRASHHKSSKRR